LEITVLSYFDFNWSHNVAIYLFELYVIPIRITLSSQ